VKKKARALLQDRREVCLEATAWFCHVTKCTTKSEITDC